MKHLNFTECATCNAQPGMPILCAACLNNRTAIEQRDKLIRELQNPKSQQPLPLPDSEGVWWEEREPYPCRVIHDDNGRLVLRQVFDEFDSPMYCGRWLKITKPHFPPVETCPTCGRERKVGE